MKYFIFFLLLSGTAYGQTTYYIKADSTRLQKVGGNNELIVENSTRNITGVLVNNGNGRTSFSKPRLNGDTLFIGKDTLIMPAGSSFDTTTIYSNLALKLNISDTAAMLGNYFNDVGYGLLRTGKVARVDSAVLSAYFLRRKDSSGWWSLYGNTGTSHLTNWVGVNDSAEFAMKMQGHYAMFLGTALQIFPSDTTFNKYNFYGSVSLGKGALKYLLDNDPTPDGGLIAIGSQAMRDYSGYDGDTVIGESIAIGSGSQRNLKQNYRNTTVGHWSFFQGETFSQHNSGFGAFAGEVNGAGSFNTAIGSNTLRNNKDGSYNAATGMFAGLSSNTCIDSVIITSSSSNWTTATVTFNLPNIASPGTTSVQATGTAIISGGQIIGVTMTNKGQGYTSDIKNFYPQYNLSVTFTGDGTSATGTCVLKSGDYNTYNGFYSGLYHKFGDENSFFGYSAGHGDAGSGPTDRSSIWDNKSTFVGAKSSRHSSIPATVVLENANAFGYNAMVGESNTIVLGDSALQTKTLIGNSFSKGDYKFQVGGSGYFARPIAEGTYFPNRAKAGLTIISSGSGYIFPENPAGTYYSRMNNVPQIDFRDSADTKSIGSIRFIESLNSSSPTSTTFRPSLFIGRGINRNDSSSLSNIVIGDSALEYGGASNINVIIGHGAARQGAGIINGVIIGNDAGRLMNGSGAVSSTFVGTSAGYAFTTGGWNTLIGQASGFQLATGSENTMVGQISGYNILGGNRNIFIGSNSSGTVPRTITGSISLGYNAGRKTIGDYNIFQGFSAGDGLDYGSYNMILGGSSGSNINFKSNHVIIADGAGTDRLIIDSLGGAYWQGTGGMKAHVGNTAQRPTATAGMFRYNSDSTWFEGHDGSTWKKFGTGSGGGVGETNTASNLGGGLANYSTKVGVDLQFNSFAAADFDLASNLITIDGTKWATLASPTFTGTVVLPAGQVVNGVTLTTGGSATTYLNGAGAYTTPAGSGTVTEVTSANADLTVATTTTTPVITVVNSPKVGGITVTGTPSVGQVPTATSGTAATWQTPTAGNTPAGNFNNIQINRNGLFSAMASDSFTVNTDGQVLAPIQPTASKPTYAGAGDANTGFGIFGSDIAYITLGGTPRLAFQGGEMRTDNSGQFSFNNNAGGAFASGASVGLGWEASGVARITDGSTGYGGLKLVNLQATGYIQQTDISTPSTPAAGFARTYVNTDSLRFINDAGTVFTLGVGGAGETNTASNVGAGIGWWKDKSGVDLRFKSATEGVGISITSNTNDNGIAIKGWDAWSNAIANTVSTSVTTLQSITTESGSKGILDVTMVATETAMPPNGLTGQKFVHWKNIGGTVTVLQVIDEQADYRETWTTATWTIDASGADLRIRVTADNTNSTEWNATYKLKFNKYQL